MAKNYHQPNYLFNNKTVDNYRITNHFHERWNERMERKFEKKYELEKFIKENYHPEYMNHISGDYFLMGGMIVVCSREKNPLNVIFITMYGKSSDNPIMYNLLMTEGVKGFKKVHKKYGKMHLKNFQ